MPLCFHSSDHPHWSFPHRFYLIFSLLPLSGPQPLLLRLPGENTKLGLLFAQSNLASSVERFPLPSLLLNLSFHNQTGPLNVFINTLPISALRRNLTHSPLLSDQQSFPPWSGGSGFPKGKDSTLWSFVAPRGPSKVLGSQTCPVNTCWVEFIWIEERTHLSCKAAKKHSEDKKESWSGAGGHIQRMKLGKNNEIFLKLHKGPYVSYLKNF